MWITRESNSYCCPVTLPLSHSMRKKPNYLGLLRTGIYGVLLEMRDFIIVRQLHLWIHSAAGSSFRNTLKKSAVRHQHGAIAHIESAVSTIILIDHHRWEAPNLQAIFLEVELHRLNWEWNDSLPFPMANHQADALF